MKISANYTNQSFGKKPIFKCTVEKSDNSGKVNATLYKLEQNNRNDEFDLYYSRIGRPLYLDFKTSNPRLKNAQFYILQEDKTQEIISAAESTQHIRQTKANEDGSCTLIDELSVNTKYKNPAEPILAHIAKDAALRADNTVTAYFDSDYIPDIKNSMFTSDKDMVWVLPQKTFGTLADSVQKKFNIQYLA